MNDEHCRRLKPLIGLSPCLKLGACASLSGQKLLSSFLAFCIFCLVWCNFTAEAMALGGKQPPLNQNAPAFTLPTNTGDGTISLKDYLGKWVVLYFYPKDFTSGCTIEARRFQQDLAKYEAKNAQIVGVSADDINSHAEFCDSEGLKFPLLADIDGSVSKAYGSWLGIVSLRHTYLIDPKGVLKEVFLDINPNVHSAEVLARLDELKKAV